MSKSMNKSPSIVEACVLAGLLIGAAIVPGLVSIVLAAPGTPDDPVPGNPYYRVPPIYIPFPQAGKTWPIKNYGPVGIGIDLIDPAFTMRINNVEKGSPAEATGRLKKGQIIESINGETLKDIDPRVQLADILGRAEATDGVMRMMVRDTPKGAAREVNRDDLITKAEATDGASKTKVKDTPKAVAQEVIVKIPVLGAYSKTWPLNCEKSDRIVRNLAGVLAKQQKPGWGSVLFLLSTGEEKDLDVVRGWMKDFEGVGSYPWFNGLLGPGVCEYYLRTGDERILPVIKQMTERLKEQIYCGGWSGRGKASFTYGYHGGHMNAAGVHCLTFLLLARQCGVDVDEHTLQSSLKQFYRFAGHGNVAYGDAWPEGGFRDNGKTGGLALAMAAAALLAPEGESSIYARARDNSAMKSFYATSWFNRAHTGGGIGEIWHGAAMQLMVDSKPAQYRSFMDERRWVYELSRRHDGSVGISDGGGYDRSATEGRSWGTYFALVYTAPRRKLRLFGAPKTPWCKTYPLPERPWGTAADDAFQSPEPGEYKPGKVQDLDRERIPTDASYPVLKRWADPEVSDDTLLMYAHHPEFAFRSGVVNTMVRKERDHLIVPLLKSKDPRVRHAGLLALTGMFKGRPLPAERVTDEMFDLAIKMLNDPEESWWVAQAAMKALTRAKPERIAPHVDRLLSFLQNDDWWMHTTAVHALTPFATDDRFYQKVLPPIAEVVKNGRAFLSTAPVGAIARNLQTASPEVHKLGLKLFREAYDAIPDPVVAPGGQITPNQTQVLRGRAYAYMRSMPGSDEVVLKLPKLTSRWQATGKEADKYVCDDNFVANKQVLGTWTVVDQVQTFGEFKVHKEKNPGRPPFGRITFRDGGETDSASRIWTGNTLVDLGRGEALKMTVRPVELPYKAEGPEVVVPADAEDTGLEVELETDEEAPKKGSGVPTEPYLFIEAGGFSASKPKDWKTPYYVLKKSK